MSVLLDALKKAAEDKKSLNKESDDSSNNEVPLKIEEASDPTIIEEELVKDDRTFFESEALSDSDDFKFQLSTEKESQEINFSDDVNQSSNDLPEFDLDSLSGEIKTQEEGASLNIATEDDAPSLQLNVEEPPPSNEFDFDNSLEENSLDSLVNSLNINEPANDLENSNDAFLDQSQDLYNVELDSKQNHKYSESVLEIQGDDQSSNTFNSSKEIDHESFDWSLDDLPGYNVDSLSQQGSSGLKLEQNPILISGANSSPQNTKNRYATSSKVLVTLFVFLFFVLIGFYGILYFQEQNEKLEKSMMKYNIAALNLQPKGNQATLNTAPLNESATGIAADNSTVKIVPQVSDEADKIEDTSNIDAPTTSTNTLSSIANNPASSSQALDSVALPAKETKVAVAEKSKSIKTYIPKKSASSSAARLNRPVSKPAVVTINKAKSLIAQAYEAFNSGNYAKAKRLFEDTLKTDSKNVKALMGLGAIAVINKEFTSAIGYYEKVLTIKPNNLDAFEAIANLAGSVPLNSDWERQLVSVADNYPSSAVLQNALGNSHAMKSDWLEAQKAYFNAVVNNPSSADYMMNLAVSYDHLGEYKLASQYYTQALAHAANSKVSFNSQQVKARLVSIKQLMIKGG